MFFNVFTNYRIKTFMLNISLKSVKILIFKVKA